MYWLNLPDTLVSGHYVPGTDREAEAPKITYPKSHN